MNNISSTKSFAEATCNENFVSNYLKNINRITKINQYTETKNHLLMYVLTWNMHGKIPSIDEVKIVFPESSKIEDFDLFIINTQECEKSAGSSVFSDSKENWEKLLKKFFEKTHRNILNSCLGSFHISIFAREGRYLSITDLKTGTIKTGFMNIMANKGAAGASFKCLDKHILCISCHLASGQGNTDKRNDDLNRIGKELRTIKNENFNNELIKLQSESQKDNITVQKIKTRGQKFIDNDAKLTPEQLEEFERKEKKGKTEFIKNNKNNLNNELIENNGNEKDKLLKKDNNDNNDLNFNDINSEDKKNNDSNKNQVCIENHNQGNENSIEDYDIVILSGDLNYRLNMPKGEVDEKLKLNNPEILWNVDQLTPKIKKDMNFNEGTITFMPTYKFKDGTSEYDTEERIPGWTDRILFRAKENYDIMLCEYKSIMEATLSDHKPVYAIFKVNCKKNKLLVLEDDEKEEEECCIF